MIAALEAAVQADADRRMPEVLARVIRFQTTVVVKVVRGFGMELPGGEEYFFCPGETYRVRFFFRRLIWNTPVRGTLWYAHELEVVSKLTMSHEHPPDQLRVCVWGDATLSNVFDVVEEGD